MAVGFYLFTTHAENVTAANGGAPKQPVPATYFGLTVLNFSKLTPTVPFGSTRSWDAGPGLDWADANPSPGVYNFAPLDQFLAFNHTRGSEPVYTFGRTPRWASAQPDNPDASYGPGQCAPPADMSHFDAYVTAIVTHAAGRIKYWELGNEPNEVGYCGDVAAMVTMAQHAHQIIKKLDPTAMILTPSVDKASGPQWLASFLSQGGAGAVDIIAFHGYWSDTAEDILPVVAALRAVAAANGLAKLPLWDTESSWAYTEAMSLPTPAAQSAYIAKSYLLHWSLGVDRLFWYAYDGNSPWGTLYTAADGETPAALAYRQTYQWMVGATLTAPCSENSNKVWSCTLSRHGGYAAEAVWIPKSNARFAVPKQYREYVDLAGTVHPVVNHTVTVGDQPILLRTGPQ